jgi:hypothetical protein
MDVKQRLKSQLNKKFKLGTTKFEIVNFELKEDGHSTVILNSGFVDFKTEKDLSHWLDELQEADSSDIEKWSPKEAQIVKSNPGYAFKIGSNVLSEMKDVAMDSIKKLQAENGADYIPQAQEINRQVGRVIDLAKTEIELVKTIQG